MLDYVSTFAPISDDEIFYLVSEAKKRALTESFKVYDTWTLKPTLGAIEYLVDVLHTNRLKPPYKALALLSNSVKNDTNINSITAYYTRIHRLIEVGILEICNDGKYIPKRDCKRYNIHIDRLIEIWKACETKLYRKKPLSRIVNNKIYSVNFNYVAHALKTGKWHELESATEEELEKNKEVFAQAVELGKSKDIRACFIKCEKELSYKEMDYLEQFYSQAVYEHNTVLRETKELLCEVNGTVIKDYNDILNNYADAPFRMPLNFRAKRVANGYIIKATARQYNDFCNVHKPERKEILKREGLDGEFDLHSAIFGVARLLNTGEFNCDWDIKNIVNYAAYDLDRDTFKSVLFRVFFSGRNSWRDYVHMCVKGRLLPMSKDKYWELHNKCQEIVGGTVKHSNDIFIKESYLELSVLAEMKKRGLSYRNVFDCFYFKTSEISVEEVKAIINEKAQDLYRLYNKIDSEEKLAA